MSEIYIKQKTSYDIIRYIKKEITTNKKISEYCANEILTKKPKDETFYRDMIKFELAKERALLKLSNNMYGKRVTNKYICKKLGIDNI